MTPGNRKRLLLLGLDGLTFSVLDPAFEAGHMPVLRSLLGRGASGILTSTIPPYTPPGWTSIFTGVNPGRHGIFGFRLGNLQRDEGLVRLERVKVPALWNIVNDQGAAVGLFNIPITYPPPNVEGYAVAGMLTPEGGGMTPEGFASPPSIEERLVSALGRYEIDIEVNYAVDWRSTALVDRLSRNLETKRRALEILLADHDVPLLFAVLEAPDRIMHVHHKYIDPSCEHFRRPEAAPIRERVWRFFDEMDVVIEELVSWAGDDGFVVTMSDHGFGPKDKAVNVNLALKQWGLLSSGGMASLGRSTRLRKIGRKVKYSLPRSLQRRAKEMGQATIDWSRTKAFSAPVPQQGIYVNLEGREPQGIVPARDYEKVRDEIVERFRSLIDPDDGRPVLDRIYRREEVMDGPEAEKAPDLFPVCRAYSYELSDGLFSPDVLTDYRDLPRGFHHMDGLFGLAGPGIPPLSDGRAHLYDVLPTALYLGGYRIPKGLDGRVLEEYLGAGPGERPPEIVPMDLPTAGAGTDASPYSPEDEAAIEESLRNLGYL